MTGRLYIDGSDAYTAYGAYVITGGWNDLLQLPPLKGVTSTDWQEENGVEADLSAPRLNTREVSIKFAIRGNMGNYNDFVAALQNGSVHTFNCVEIGRIFHLRLISYSSVDMFESLGLVTAKFADDYPLENYTHTTPTGGGVAYSDEYKIDDTALTEYGIRLTKGTFSDIIKPGQVKQAMLRNIASRSGAIYDTASPVQYKTKDTKLNCLLRANSLEELWRNYYGLCYQITQPGIHRLSVQRLSLEYPFYYKSCQVSEFGKESNGRIWLQFTLVITINGNTQSLAYMRFTEAKTLRMTEAGGMRLY